MLALEFVLEGGDLLLLGVGVVASAFVADGEGSLGVVEELLLPVVEEGDGDVVFFTDIGNRDFFEKVQSEDGDFLRDREMATLSGHEYSSARVLPLTLAKASSCFDWSNT